MNKGAWLRMCVCVHSLLSTCSRRQERTVNLYTKSPSRTRYQLFKNDNINKTFRDYIKLPKKTSSINKLQDIRKLLQFFYYLLGLAQEVVLRWAFLVMRAHDSSSLDFFLLCVRQQRICPSVKSSLFKQEEKCVPQKN